MTVAKIWDGAQWVKIEGVPGPQGIQGVPGQMEVYEQAGLPSSTNRGAVWIDTDESPVASPTALAPVVTTLPSSPADGQEVYWQFGSGGATVLWHMRYWASSPDINGYKWHFLGGETYNSISNANGNAYGDGSGWRLGLATAPAAINAEGTYRFSIEGRVTMAAAADEAYLGGAHLLAYGIIISQLRGNVASGTWNVYGSTDFQISGTFLGRSFTPSIKEVSGKYTAAQTLLSGAILRIHPLRVKAT